MFNLLLHSALCVFIYVTVWFFIALIQQRNDVADIAWGLGFIVVSAFCFCSYPHAPVALLVYALVTLWGVRGAYRLAQSRKNGGFSVPKNAG